MGTHPFCPRQTASSHRDILLYNASSSTWKKKSALCSCEPFILLLASFCPPLLRSHLTPYCRTFYSLPFKQRSPAQLMKTPLPVMNLPGEASGKRNLFRRSLRHSEAPIQRTHLQLKSGARRWLQEMDRNDPRPWQKDAFLS